MKFLKDGKISNFCYMSIQCLFFYDKILFIFVESLRAEICSFGGMSRYEINISSGNNSKIVKC